MTRRMPAALIASTHGGVLPVELQGSRVTSIVSQSAAGTEDSAALRRASTSAWGPPQTLWNPRATT